METPGTKRFISKGFEFGTDLVYRLFSRKPWFKNRDISEADGDYANLGKSEYSILVTKASDRPNAVGNSL